jgi:CBS domain-containing protein
MPGEAYVKGDAVRSGVESSPSRILEERMQRGSVAGIIEGRVLVTQPPTATVREAARVMAEKGIGAVPVVEGRKLIGIFTERDIVAKVIALGRDVDRSRLEEVMTRRPETVSTHCPLAEVLEVMISGGFRHLPVMSQGEVVGVVSMRDIYVDYRLLQQGAIGLKDEVSA